MPAYRNMSGGPLPAAALVLASLLLSPAYAESNQKGVVTLDDVLHLESLSGGAFSPDGKMFVFTKGRSIADRDGSSNVPGLDSRLVEVVDRQSGATAEVVGPTPQEHFTLLRLGSPFSPDGRFIALQAIRPDRSGMALWDVSAKRLRWLPGELANDYEPAGWLQDGRFVYAAAAAGEGVVPGGAFISGLTARWTNSWSGKAPQVTVTSANPVIESSLRPEGALMLARAADGKAVPLAKGDYSAIRVSPDSRHIAVIRRAEIVGSQTFNSDGRRGELQVFVVGRSGAQLEARFADFDASWRSLSWSSDGSALLVGGRGAPSAPIILRVYRTETHALEPVETGDLSFQDPRAETQGSQVLPVGWLGSTPVAIAAESGKGSKEGQSSTPGLNLHYGELDKLRLDLWAFPSKGRRKLTASMTQSTLSFAAPADYGAAFVTAEGALWRITVDGSPERLTPNDGPPVLALLPQAGPDPSPSDAFARSSSGRLRVSLMVLKSGRPAPALFDLAERRFLADDGSGMLVAATADLSARILLDDEGKGQALKLFEDGHVSLIAQVNRFLDERADGEVVKIPYKVGDQQLTAWAIKPPHLAAGAKVPAVVFVYGGQVWGGQPPMFAGIGVPSPVYNGQLLAAQGYVVIYPSLPLRKGSESDFPQLLADETVAAVDATAAAGLIDPERVAILGHSFGGYTTAAVLSKASSRFRAGISLAGIYDPIGAYGGRGLAEMLQGGDKGWRTSIDAFEKGQMLLEAPPWRALDAYVRNSPFFNVEHIDSPLLIMQGDLDFGVTSIFGAERMYGALVRAGKKPVLVRYWGEDHMLNGQANIRDQWGKILLWLSQYLKS